MNKKWMCRRLPVVVFAVVIILSVDFQLRTGASAPHARRSPAVPRLAHSTRHAQRAADINGSSSAFVSSSQLKLEQVFIGVKTTGRFHGTRLALLLQTWISRTKAQVGSERTAVKVNRACACACVGAATRRCFQSVAKQMPVICKHVERYLNIRLI